MKRKEKLVLAKPSMRGRAIAGDRQRSLGTHRKQSVQLEQNRGGNAEFPPVWHGGSLWEKGER